MRSVSRPLILVLVACLLPLAPAVAGGSRPDLGSPGHRAKRRLAHHGDHRPPRPFKRAPLIIEEDEDDGTDSSRAVREDDRPTPLDAPINATGHCRLDHPVSPPTPQSPRRHLVLNVLVI